MSVRQSDISSDTHLSSPIHSVLLLCRALLYSISVSWTSIPTRPLLPYSRSPCLSSLESHPFPVSPPSFSRQRCCSPIRPTASFWPLTPVPLEARAPPHPPGPNPPTPRVSPSTAGLCGAPRDSTGQGKALTPCTLLLPHCGSDLLSCPAGTSTTPGAKGKAAGLSSVPSSHMLLSRATEVAAVVLALL